MSVQVPVDGGPAAAWRDPELPPARRAEALIPLMTLDEKVAQLVGVWVGAQASGDGVAPHQFEMTADTPPWPEVIRSGLGQLTRPFGTAPIDPGAGARALAAAQAQIVAASRFGIPAQVHEECLTGFATWRATVYPTPLCWGAAFDPALVREMGIRIGRSMRAAGVHQGLAPVLDVTRDYRWGRTEETIGEDPYLVGTVGAGYVRGLTDAGVVATLKHFAGYSASRGGRNLAPVSMGRRELRDVILPPFEMALRLGGARSVMNSYAEIDGVPVAADEGLLTFVLRDEWGFTGTVVSDYFSVRFLQTLHGVAADAAAAAGAALRAGIDVELPTVDTFGAPLIAAVREGLVDEALVDRALRRVLTQKAELGLLDEDWDAGPRSVPRLDDEAGRDVALRLARQSIVLLRNDHGVLPLHADQRIALVGPLADDPLGFFGCYAFPTHVGVNYPEHGIGVDVPTLRASLEAVLDGARSARAAPGAISAPPSLVAPVATLPALLSPGDAGPRGVPTLVHEPGCAVDGDDRSGIAAAAVAAAGSDVCVLAVGDRAGMFGRGTSGEGCDAADLRLPGVQADLVRAVLATGTPVVLVVVSGRPYALGPEFDAADAVVQSFFPGQLGGRALAEILVGAVEPAGRLPVSVPRTAGGVPATYLTPPLGRCSDLSSVDPTPAFPFGHGLAYTTFEWSAAGVSTQDWPTDGEVTAHITVRNTGTRPGTDVVQLYLHDPVAPTTRPVVRLIGYARVALEPGACARVAFTVPADVTSFTGVDGRRIVDPGDVELRFGRSSGDFPAVVALTMVGAERVVGHDRRLETVAEVHP